MHSYKEPEVVVKCLDIIKYYIGYVKVWNEAGIEAYRPAPAIPLRLRLVSDGFLRGLSPPNPTATEVLLQDWCGRPTPGKWKPGKCDLWTNFVALSYTLF